MTRQEARAFVIALKNLRDSATDAQASTAAYAYPTLKYDSELVPASTRINWNGRIKRAAVDLWDTTENNPDNAPTLWEDINYREGYRTIPEVITVGTAFSKGERGWWMDDLYESTIDNNVWTPAAYPAGWSVVE